MLSCTVLRACLVELQSGEVLISLITGDDQRWLIDHTATGAGGKTPLASVKPVDYNITTNLIISTDRRVYHITLDSPPRTARRQNYNPLGHYTRHIRFYYPNTQAWTSPPNLELSTNPGMTLESLPHRYAWKRDKEFPWEPAVVLDDGERVYIRLPDEALAFEQPLLSFEKGVRNVWLTTWSVMTISLSPVYLSALGSSSAALHDAAGWDDPARNSSHFT